MDRRRRDKGHHRYRIRQLNVTALASIDYFGARQAIEVVRWRRDPKTGKLTSERVYLGTSLDVFDTISAELAAGIRDH